MQITYKALGQNGKIIHGTLEATTLSEAANILRSKEYLPVVVKEKKQPFFSSTFAFLDKPNFSTLVFFTRQLASMLAAGLTLSQALQILEEQMTNATFAHMLHSIILEVEEGNTFSSAIEKYPGVFSPVYIATVRAGEASGLYDKVFSRLADNLEKQQELQNDLRSALIYPALVVIAIAIVIAIMMIFVVPQFSVLYKDLNVALPLPTQIVIGISNFFTWAWPIVIAVGIIFFVVFRRWKKTKTGELVIDNVLIKIPIIGQLNRQVILAELTRSMGLLIGSGNLVVDAIRKSADITGNVYFRNALMGIAQAVERGISISDAMRGYDLFPPLLVQSIHVGEETGKLDDALLRASQFYEREVDRLVKSLTTLLEPLLITVLGVVVAFIILSVITPIYKLVNQF